MNPCLHLTIVHTCQLLLFYTFTNILFVPSLGQNLFKKNTNTVAEQFSIAYFFGAIDRTYENVQ